VTFSSGTVIVLASIAAWFVLVTLAALWLALRRARRWKEEITELKATKDRENLVAAIPEETSLRGLIRSHVDAAGLEEIPGPNVRYGEYTTFLQSLDHANEGSRTYLAIHLHRTARTLAMAPPPARTARALELGAYGYMASGLGCVGGYREVPCAYLGTAGQHISRPVLAAGKEIFRCEFHLFDAERDRFPYPDAHFDLILACEVLEHLARDPVHMLLECSRVLDDNGALLVTTPNTVSYTSVARALTASGNPQIYSVYGYEQSESPHVREYTPEELRDALAAAGFGVESLFTEIIEGCDANVWVAELLRRLDLPTTLRGEQIYCLARKKPGMPITRYPRFLYEQGP
jgi:SAM-dependent methyltransferase